MGNLEGFIKDRINHADKRASQIKKKHGGNPSNTHTYHGGWNLGYWEGVKAAYENISDEIEKV